MRRNVLQQQDGVDPAPATPLAPSVLESQAEPPNQDQSSAVALKKKKPSLAAMPKVRTLIKPNPIQPAQTKGNVTLCRPNIMNMQ